MQLTNVRFATEAVQNGDTKKVRNQNDVYPKHGDISASTERRFCQVPRGWGLKGSGVGSVGVGERGRVGEGMWGMGGGLLTGKVLRRLHYDVFQVESVDVRVEVDHGAVGELQHGRENV